MRRQKLLGLLVLLLVPVAAIVFSDAERTVSREKTDDDASAAVEAAWVTGKAVSPDERFEIAAVYGSSGHIVSGVEIPESLQVADHETGEVLWEDQGYLTQSVLWSPDSAYLALSYGGRTWNQVKIIETDTWTAWDVLLPDGKPIPDYVFLPEDWGAWLDENTLRLTVGRGGDEGEQETYCCAVFRTESGQVSGDTYLQATEHLPGDWDFDHDGAPEAITLTSVLLPGIELWAPLYELNIERQDGTLLWTQEGTLAHAGYVSIFACESDGRDYLLRYIPGCNQGYHFYTYELFSLDDRGDKVPIRENQVAFDLMFDAPIHESFDLAAIAAFFEEVHGWIDESTLLVSTLNGGFRSGGSGADFRQDIGDMDFWSGGTPAYDESLSLEDNLQALEAYWSK